MSNGRFQKGQSGNPGGRPKIIAEIQDLARQHTEKAIDTLAAIMSDDGASASARVSAANTLLDRGYGKAPQFIQEEFKSVQEMSKQQLLAIIAQGEGATEE